MTPGEFSKTRQQKENIENFMLENDYDRSDIIIAFGGGIVTDVGGYVASTYKRGISFYNIPTTLLCMADASIGGKTGVNTIYGKNLIGTFYDPLRIYICPSVLETLDQRNISNGMAEIIKAAAIADKQLFKLLANENYQTLFKDIKNNQKLWDVIKTSMKIKLNIVSQDPTEKNLRETLNFGHTIGHSIEYASEEQLLHGECVGIGMIKECEIAAEMGLLDYNSIQQLADVLKRYKLPIEIPSQYNFPVNELLKLMESDKKKQQGQIKMSLISSIGQAIENSVKVGRDQIYNVLSKQCLMQPPTKIDLENVKQIWLPGSKSLTNRILLLASVCSGVTKITNFQESEDTKAMLDTLVILKACKIIEQGDGYITVQGHGGKIQTPNDDIDIQNAGTAARFITAFLATTDQEVIVNGSQRMKERPMTDLISVLREQNKTEFVFKAKENYLPYIMKNNGLKGGEFLIKSKTSSQFVSALLMAAPLAQGSVTIILEDIEEQSNQVIVSEPYIEMTVQVMKLFGVQVERTSRRTFKINQQPYTTPGSINIEPDSSTATYDLLFTALHGGKILIRGLGVDSQQGDTQFAETLSRLGGCVYRFIEEGLYFERNLCEEMSPIDIDMNTQTDAFITLSVLLSQVQGKSVIRGIANQRVKESNRIEAVVNNLMRCGIFCREIEDGLIIYGKRLNVDVSSSGNQRIQNKKEIVVIQTFNDHRLAMAFSILGSYIPKVNSRIQLVIDDKHCVKKTFANFWNHIKNIYYIQPGIQTYNDNIGAGFKNKQNTLIVVGMRAAGKSTLSKIAADALNLNFIDLDDIILGEIQKLDSKWKSILDYVNEMGWSGFRDIETQCLENILVNFQNYQNYIIALGGGVVERQENMYMLQLFKEYILFIDRSYEDIKVDPGLQVSSRPQLNQNTLKEKLLLNEVEYWDMVHQQFIKRVKFILEGAKAPLIPDFSFFNCVSASALISQTNPGILVEKGREYNAIELRLDHDINQVYNNIELEGIQQQQFQEILSYLRNLVCVVRFMFNECGIPLIVTLRTRDQGGFMDISDSNKRSIYFQILENIAQTGVEYIDLETDLFINCDQIKKFQEKFPLINIIYSKHYFKPVNDETLILKDIQFINQNCVQCGIDIAKIVLHENSSQKLVQSIQDSFQNRLICFKLGQKGKLSRVLNTYLIPVYDTHYSQPAAPGQMTKKEINDIRNLLSLSHRVQMYYLIGTSIEYSPSPLLHNFFFNYHKLNCNYQRAQVKSLEEAVSIIKQEQFFGGSITMPFKKDIISYLDNVDTVSQKLKVVNTVIKINNRLYGYNTDIYGIYNNIKGKIKSKEIQFGIVIGAGGTAETAIYCLNMLNIIPIVTNRTVSKAKNLAQQSNCFYVESLEEIQGLKYHEDSVQNESYSYLDHLCIIISTIPGTIHTTIHQQYFQSNPLVFECSYIPRDTPLIQQARKYNCTNFVYGIDMLVQQGIKQFELFSGKYAPDFSRYQGILDNYYSQVLETIKAKHQ